MLKISPKNRVRYSQIAAWKSALVFLKQWNSLPQMLVFFVTSRCNARCDFCLYRSQVENPVKKESELKIKEIEQIAKNYGPLNYLTLAGGEPFIRKDIEPLCQTFIDNCKTSTINISSNFSYGDTMVETMESLVRKNPSVMFEMLMSIDDIGEKHDRSRKVKNLYKTAIESFKRMTEIKEKYNNLKLRIAIVYLERNRGNIENIVSGLCNNLDIDRINISFPQMVLPSNQPRQEIALQVENFSRIADKISKMTTSKQIHFDPYTIGMRSANMVYHRFLNDMIRNNGNLGSFCEAGRYIVVINEKGEVFPCEPLWYLVGNLREHNYDIKKILNGEKYKEFRIKYLGKDKCNCTWACAILSCITVRPRFLLEIAKSASMLACKEYISRIKCAKLKSQL